MYIYMYMHIYIYIYIYVYIYISHNNPIISHYTTMFLGFGSPSLVDQLPLENKTTLHL